MTAEVMKTKEYFLKIVSSVLNSEELPCADSQVSFSLLCKLASRNKVEAILYTAFSKKYELFPQEDFEKLKRAYKLSAIRQLTQENELAEIRRVFSENNIPFMLLKGTHLKALYPSPDLRFMVDMDILMNESDLPFGKDILLKRGFELKTDNGKDIIFIKKPFLTVELHRSLFQEDFFLYPFFTDSLKKGEGVSGSEIKMKNEDLYVYTLAHLAEHYMEAGSCFRPTLDLYLTEKKYPELDFSYINARFKEMGILEFASNIRRLGKAMLEGSEKDNTLEMMENYIILGADKKSTEAASAMAGKKKSKAKRILSVAFPSFKHMKLRYPILERFAFLLPFLWLIRLLKYAFTKEERIAKKRDILKSIDSSGIDSINEIMKKSGL